MGDRLFIFAIDVNIFTEIKKSSHVHFQFHATVHARRLAAHFKNSKWVNTERHHSWFFKFWILSITINCFVWKIMITINVFSNIYLIFQLLSWKYFKCIRFLLLSFHSYKQKNQTCEYWVSSWVVNGVTQLSSFWGCLSFVKTESVVGKGVGRDNRKVVYWIELTKPTTNRPTELTNV